MLSLRLSRPRTSASLGMFTLCIRKQATHCIARMTALHTYVCRVHVGPLLPTTMQAFVKPSPFPSTTQQNPLYFTPSAKRRAKRAKFIRDEQLEPSLASISSYCFCQRNSLSGSPICFFLRANPARRQKRRQSSRWHCFALKHARPPATRARVAHPAPSRSSRPYQKKMSCSETSYTSMGHAHGQNSRSCMGGLRGITCVSRHNTASLASPVGATPCVNQTPDQDRSSSAPFCPKDSRQEWRSASLVGVEHADRQCWKTVAQDETGGLREFSRHLQ